MCLTSLFTLCFFFYPVFIWIYDSQQEIVHGRLLTVLFFSILLVCLVIPFLLRNPFFSWGQNCLCWSRKLQTSERIIKIDIVLSTTRKLIYHFTIKTNRLRGVENCQKSYAILYNRIYIHLNSGKILIGVEKQIHNKPLMLKCISLLWLGKICDVLLTGASKDKYEDFQTMIKIIAIFESVSNHRETFLLS